MRQFVLRRMLFIIPTLILVSIFVFSIIRLIPGDVASMLVADSPRLDTVDELRHELGLDRPIYTQYFAWVGDMLRGEWGNSLWTGRSIIAEIKPKFPATLELAFLSLFFMVIIAVPLGVYSAVRQDTAGDYIARSLAILQLSVPYFWVGTLVIVFPSIWWGWVPLVRYVPLWEDPLSNLGQFLLPALILGAHRIGTTLRLTRAMMLEVLRQDYVRTAWAKGLAEQRIIYVHALKNAFIPVITQIGLQIPALLGGVVIMEALFGIPGVGKFTYDVVTLRDYPMIQAMVLIFTVIVVLANLLVDITYGWLDPRIRFR